MVEGSECSQSDNGDGGPSGSSGNSGNVSCLRALWCSHFPPVLTWEGQVGAGQRSRKVRVDAQSLTLAPLGKARKPAWPRVVCG